jgi:predicted TIM-barrel fold metal-dependent hydrolase
MRLADAHIHLFSSEDLAAYERIRAQEDVDAALVVGYEGLPRYAGNNDLVLELTRDRPALVPLAFVPASAPDPARLAALAGRGFGGITLYVTDEAAADQLAAWPAEAVRAVAEHCPIVSVNLRAPLAERVAGTLAGFAPATVLLSHLGLPGRFTAPPSAAEARDVLTGVLDLARHDHLAVKLSGYYATTEPRESHPHQPARPFVDVLLDRFGPGRCYWGSDFPPALAFVSFAQAVDCYLPSALTPTERTSVMGGNLRALLAQRKDVA